MYNAFKQMSKQYSATERAAMFHDTATRVYRIAA
jgi:predicted TIM-barrel fold metal-dependent hydrolase